LLYHQHKLLLKDWGLGIGDWGLGPNPHPQSPWKYIKNFNFFHKLILVKLFLLIYQFFI
jgi:hypothetical protein